MLQNSSDGAVRGCVRVCERIEKCTKMQSTAEKKMRVECCSATSECTIQLWNFGETAKLSPKSRTTGCPNRYLHGLPTYRTAPTVLPLTAQTSGQEAALRVSFCCVLTKTNGTPHTFERDNGRKAQEALATLLSVELQKMRSNHTLDLIAATKARYLAGSKATEACQTAHKAALKNELLSQIEIQQRGIEGDVNRKMWISKESTFGLGV